MSYEEKGAWVYLTVVLGTYGAYLAVSWAGQRGAGVEARAERRQRIRRKADRRKDLRQDAYGVPM